MYHQNQFNTHPLRSAEKVQFIGPMLKQSDFALVEKQIPTMFIDRGFDFHPLLNIEKKLILSIGDGDSCQQKQNLDILLPAKKDFSDLSAGLSFLSKEVKEITFLGFLGGRSDHELCNFGEIEAFLKSQKQACRAYFEREFHALSAGHYKFLLDGTFTLITFEECFVKISGAVAYATAEKVLFKAFSSLGLSNHANGTVIIECDKPVFLITPNLRIWHNRLDKIEGKA